MKNLLLTLLSITLIVGCTPEPEPEEVVVLHEGSFSFCGASGAVPTGKKITVQGTEFDEGCAICPVMNGLSISNLAMEGESETWGEFNVKENQKTPDGTDGTTWSFFWFFTSNDTVPQFNPETNGWEWLPPTNRKFIVDTNSPSTSMSNMFAMPCDIIDTLDNGIILSKCYGPLNEAAVPLRFAIPVDSGMTSVTAAKEGFPYPVGTPIPVK
jgi:hypothetical protein